SLLIVEPAAPKLEVGRLVEIPSLIVLCSNRHAYDAIHQLSQRSSMPTVVSGGAAGQLVDAHHRGSPVSTTGTVLQDGPAGAARGDRRQTLYGPGGQTRLVD